VRLSTISLLSFRTPRSGDPESIAPAMEMRDDKVMDFGFAPSARPGTTPEQSLASRQASRYNAGQMGA
jgi:hypothetical protein